MSIYLNNATPYYQSNLSSLGSLGTGLTQNNNSIFSSLLGTNPLSSGLSNSYGSLYGGNSLSSTQSSDSSMMQMMMTMMMLLGTVLKSGSLGSANGESEIVQTDV